MRQTWNDLLFAHWPLALEALQPLVPAPLQLDRHHGQGWVAVTPFHMSGIRARFLPPLPGVAAFPELNVRTYVTYNGKPGVFFFSLDAASRTAVGVARALFRLPYYFARMESREREGWIHYRSTRGDRGVRLRAQYRSCRPVELRQPGSLEHWLTERYCLYTVAGGRVFRAEIHHAPWPLQDAEAQIFENTVAAAAGLCLPAAPQFLHFSRKIDVLIWRLRRA
jgi:uncharacterized protein YqjF (DUF2071 family)